MHKLIKQNAPAVLQSHLKRGCCMNGETIGWPCPTGSTFHSLKETSRYHPMHLLYAFTAKGTRLPFSKFGMKLDLRSIMRRYIIIYKEKAQKTILLLSSIDQLCLSLGADMAANPSNILAPQNSLRVT